MKTLCLVLLIALAIAQTPIPLINLNLSDISGLWYIVWEYSSLYNNNVVNNIDCLKFFVAEDPESEGGEILEYIYSNGKVAKESIPFTVGSYDSIWNVTPLGQYDWVAYDFISGSFATWAAANRQAAAVFSRTPYINNISLALQVKLLMGEGYTINATNVLNYTNVGCPK